MEMQVFNREQKLVQGIKDGEGLQRDEVDLAIESANTLPLIPKWLGTYKNSITNSKRFSS